MYTFSLTLNELKSIVSAVPGVSLYTSFHMVYGVGTYRLARKSEMDSCRIFFDSGASSNIDFISEAKQNDESEW